MEREREWNKERDELTDTVYSQGKELKQQQSNDCLHLLVYVLLSLSLSLSLSRSLSLSLSLTHLVRYTESHTSLQSALQTSNQDYQQLKKEYSEYKQKAVSILQVNSIP